MPLGWTACTRHPRGCFGFRPEGGLTSIRIPVSLTSQFNQHWSHTVAGRYERLLNDAADSPIVRTRGNENQWTVGGGDQLLLLNQATTRTASAKRVFECSPSTAAGVEKLYNKKIELFLNKLTS